jgi:hypothetical protein
VGGQALVKGITGVAQLSDRMAVSLQLQVFGGFIGDNAAEGATGGGGIDEAIASPLWVNPNHLIAGIQGIGGHEVGVDTQQINGFSLVLSSAEDIEAFAEGFEAQPRSLRQMNVGQRTGQIGLGRHSGRRWGRDWSQQR